MDKNFCPYCMNPVKEGETCTNCGLTEGVYTPRDHHLPLGSVLHDRYLVGRVLGEGGFGITYIGCDLNLEMKVAIKEYFPIDRVYRFSQASLEVSNYAHAAEKFHSGKVKFLREARTMARLDKLQNIVSVKDFFEENNTAYIVMEYVEGTTLKELVNQRGGRIPAGELLYMLEPLFPALTSVHELGLIHRDISPDNLMLENGKIKLLDFGCARESSAQSETMTIALKQGFAPIEQYQHKGQGPWTDVYALSATVYYCLTGKTPQSAVDRLNEEELVPPRRLGVDLTADQETALLHGMNVKAKDRFQSVDELYVALYTNVMPEPKQEAPVMENPPRIDSAANVPARVEPARVDPVRVDPVPEQRTDSGGGIKNGSWSKTVVLDPNGEIDLSETDYDEEKSVKERIIEVIYVLKQQLKNRKLMFILAGCAVLLVAVICIVLIVIPSKDEPEETMNHTDEVGALTDDSQLGSQTDPVQETELYDTLFADTVAPTELSADILQQLMDDETVPAIRISEGVDAGAVYGALTITKPVLVEKNASLTLFDPITVQGENACLWVEGEAGSNCIIRTTDGGRIVADNHDCIWAEILWLERDEDIRILNGEKHDYTNLIVGGRNTLFQDAVEVRDVATLYQAIDANQAAVICEDMTITEGLESNVPILIEEGAAVSFQNVVALREGAFLWNEGWIQSYDFYAYSGAGIINYGEMINTKLLQLDAVLVNMGELELQQYCAQGDEMRGLVCNIGNLRFSGAGGNYNISLVNSGTVACAADGWFDISPGAAGTEIINYGEFRVEKGITKITTYLKNGSDGRIILCDNATLHNEGIIEMYSGEFVCEPGGILSNEAGAIYCHYTTQYDYVKDGWVHLKNPLDLPRVCEVSSFGALYDALQDPEVEKICVTGTVSWNVKEPLILTKEMEISGHAELIMTEGSELILDGCFLLNSGYLKVDNLTLTHGSSLQNMFGTIEMNTPESIIKLGNAQGESNYNGTDCIMNDNGEIHHYGEMTFYDNALMIQKGYLEETSIRILGHACVLNMGEIQWGDEGIIDISGRGQFHNMVRQDWLQNLSIGISKDGTFYESGGLVVEKGNLYVAPGGAFIAGGFYITLGNDFSFYNNGYASFAIGGDNSQLQGYLENNGYFYLAGPTGFLINAPVGAANPAWMNNQGEMHLDPEAYIRTLNGEFTGNEVIYEQY